MNLQQLKQLEEELIHGLYVDYRIKTLDPFEKKTFDSGWKPSKSFVLQWMQCNEASWRALDNPDYVEAKDVTNTLRKMIKCRQISLGNSGDIYACNAGLGDGSYGVVVGTGVGAEANDDYQLGTKIAHGTGSGELEYEGTNWAYPHDEAGGKEFDIWRSFHNDSGGSITVQEFGIYAYHYCWVSGSTYSNEIFLIIRDVDSLVIADNSTGTVTYSFRTVV